MESTNEKVFFQKGHVTVTQSRFISHNKTFAMRNISSVNIHRKEKSKAFQIICILIGFLLLLADGARVLGVILILFGIGLLILIKDEFSVRINSNSGESDGFISTDQGLVKQIVDAVNEAIVFRG